MTRSIAERMFDYRFAENELNEKLDDSGVQYDRLGFDYYDCSLELHDVPDDYCLSPEAQKIIYDAGFLKCYVNHINKWETHYTFNSKEFVAGEGWRVSYPRKRGGEGTILVEKTVEGWPVKWFETGYVVVKND